MLYRLVSVTIVVFWLVMTALLVRNEVNPAASSLREIPVGHVLKQLFIHEQRSNLRIYSGSTPIGHFYMHPRVNSATDTRVLEIMCNLVFERGPHQKQRISWETTMHMNPEHEVRMSHHKINLEPGLLGAEIRTSSDRPTMNVRLTSGNQVYERDMTLNQSGIESVAQEFGATGDVLTLLQQPGAKDPPAIRARQSYLRVGDQRTETFLVTIESNGQTLLECHFSLLGQALRANTVFGYTLRDDLLP